jgi:cell wall-associated NlpC family hydrolase
MKFQCLFCVLFILSFYCECFSQEEAHLNHNGFTNEHDTTRLPIFYVDSLVQFANQFVGTPYKAAGKSPKGFDCSGFSFYCFKNYGIYLPYSAPGQAQVGKEIPSSEAEAGDLIFFRGRNINDKKVHHVGILVNKKGGKLNFIHCSSSRGICYETIDSPYYKPRFVKIKRVYEQHQ